MATSETYPFPHARLDCWYAARQARTIALASTASLPAGFGDEARQINNAAASVVRNVAEGANRFRPAEKVLESEIAAGEAGEAVSAVLSLQDTGLGDEALAQQFCQLEARVGAMLTGLIRRHRR